MESNKKPITVREAGRLGGQANAASHSHEWFVERGKQAGAATKRLIEAGKAAEAEEK